MKTFKSTLILMCLMACAIPAQAQLGGLLNKAKKAVKETVTQTTKATTTELNAKVAENMPNASTVRGEAPWPMKEKGTYKNMDVTQFIMNMADESQEDIVALREQLFARFKENMKLLQVPNNPLATEAQEENQRFLILFGQMAEKLGLILSGVTYENGSINFNNPYRTIVNRRNGGIDVFVYGNTPEEFVFRNLGGNTIVLDQKEMNHAKDCALRCRRFQDLSKGVHVMMEEAGFTLPKTNTSLDKLRVLYNLSGIYARGVETAIANNSPKNIEYMPRPAAGALHNSLKAQALKIAQEKSNDVVDIIITSSSWDVKMKGGVPVNRNVYGFYIYKEEHGLRCYPRMWTESYMGNGKYGQLRAGGVGTTSPFYIK